MDKKKRIKRYVTWAGIAALVALLAVMPLLAKNEAAQDGPVASVLSAQVAKGDIPLVLRGGGTLANKGEQDVNIPTGVKITEFLVKNGDVVASGDPVARVDKVSVMAAITGVAETMDFIREELEDGRDEKVDSSVVATAGGRVKEIFAAAGDSVQDVMLRQGALALLSIDGLMAVKLEVPASVTTGERVTVTLSDGEEITGRVESNLSGQIIVTVEDDGYAIGEKATVTLEDGTVLGSGELYVHNAWKAVAHSGTVNAVSIRKEQELSSGATLFTLTDTAYKGQLNHRASQHREYEELLQKLLSMYESGYITAPCDGVVSGVDEDSAHLLSAGIFAAEVTLLGGPEDWGNVQLMLLGGTVAPPATCSKDTACTAPKGAHDEGCPNYICLDSANDGECKAAAGKHNSTCIESCKHNLLDETCPATGAHKAICITHCKKAATDKDICNAQTHSKNCIKSCERKTTEGDCKSKVHYSDCIESCTNGTATKECLATGAHKATCIRTCLHGKAQGDCVKDAKYPHYYDCIQSCTEDDNCLASVHKDKCPLKEMTFMAQLAKVDYVGNTVLGVYWDTNSYPVSQGANGWQLLSPDYTGQNFLTKGELAVDNPGSYSKGDVVMVVTGYKGSQVEWSRTVKYSSGGGSKLPDMGGMNFNFSLDISGMMGGFAGYGNYSGAAMPQTENLYDLKGSTLMTVTPDEGVEVEIRLDERDISKVQEGMAATIKVEALRGKEFSGTVARVGAIAEHSGSTGKFTVRVEADAIADSLPGMSSTVTIHRETREDVLTLPVAAVSQDGAKTIVYTALDSKSGQPASPQEVTTGVSDGEHVEVFGLEEGTTVYYLYYDVLELDHTARERQFNMN